MKPHKPRGPKAQTLVIDRDWKDAVRTAMKKGKPPTPESPKKKKPRGK
jgi:hypothetical protein